MVLKVPLYVDFDSRDVNQDLITEISSMISGVVTESLQKNLKKKETKILFHDENGEQTEARTFKVISAQEAIQRFK